MSAHNYLRQNNNPAFNNPKFFTIITSVIEKKVGRQLTNLEIRFINNFIRKISPNYLAEQSQKKNFYDLTAKYIIDKMRVKEEPIDMKKILKNNIGRVEESDKGHDIYDRIRVNDIPRPKKQNFLGVDNINNLTKIINPSAMVKTQYLILDSRFKNEIESDTKNLKWDYSPEKINEGGTFALSGKVRDIISFKIFPFKIPYTEDADTKRQILTLFIKELNSQAFIAQQNRRFNFVLYTTVNSEFIELKPAEENDGDFIFYKTLTKLDSITINIGDPNKLIEFPRERDRITLDYFSISPLTLITTTEPHNLSNGDIVIISNFDYGFIDPILVDQIRENEILKNLVNSEDGYEVTVISPTEISIDLDTSGIMSPLPPGTQFDIYYDSKRIYIPMEIKYVNPIE